MVMIVYAAGAKAKKEVTIFWENPPHGIACVYRRFIAYGHIIAKDILLQLWLENGWQTESKELYEVQY